MPIVFSTCLERDILYAHWSGRVGLEEFRQNYFDYLADAFYRPGRTELVDLTDFEDFDGDFNAIRSALAVVNTAGEGPKNRTRTVLLAPRESVFGLGRMYQQLAEIAGGIEVELYTQEIEALQALLLPYKTIPELLEKEKFQPHTQRDDVKASCE
ncbi:MAG: hypothetical protein AAF689_13395 [Pseudomonadota bacterium]